MTTRARWRRYVVAGLVGGWVARAIWQRRRVFWGHDARGAYRGVAIGPVSVRTRMW